MRTSLALLALPLAASAASLSEFKPYAEDLPSSCDRVYRTKIPGCVDSDFQSGTCSKACFQGLQYISVQVMRSCVSQGNNGNIIGAFLTASGPQQLCKKVSNGDDDSDQQSTSQSPQSTSSPTPSSSASSSSTRSSTQTPTSSSTSSQATSTSSRSVTSIVQSASSSVAPSSTASSTTSSSASLASQVDLSHGGSPFDITSQSDAPRSAYGSLAGLFTSLALSLLALNLI